MIPVGGPSPTFPVETSRSTKYRIQLGQVQPENSLHCFAMVCGMKEMFPLNCVQQALRCVFDLGLTCSFNLLSELRESISLALQNHF